MVFNKKAISPVVATALLLVVAVVAVVGFQTWFTSYNSGLQAKVDAESNAGASSFEVSYVSKGGDIYIRNRGTSDISGLKMTLVNGTDCLLGGGTITATASSVTKTTYNTSQCTDIRDGKSTKVIFQDSGDLFQTLTVLAK